MEDIDFLIAIGLVMIILGSIGFYVLHQQIETPYEKCIEACGDGYFEHDMELECLYKCTEFITCSKYEVKG